MAQSLKTLNNILDKICKENNVERDNVHVNEYYKYVETINHSKKDASYYITIYRGKKYSVRYFDGCFNPFVIEIK